MLRENVQNLDAVMFTHHHKDHVAGMDDIRPFNHKWKKEINIYCNVITEQALYKEFPYVFSDDDYPGIPKVRVNIFDNNEFKIGKTTILPIRCKHYRLPVFGFRINNFVYLTDVSYISESEKEKMKGADLIILDALRQKKHVSHFNLEQAVDLLEELKPRNGLLTHISHFMGLHDEVNQSLPENINLSYDGQIINL